MWLHDLVQVGVLGPLLVRVGDREATPRGQRQRDAFVALVQRRGRPVPADVLYDLIWPAPTRELTGLAVVHTAVARLRRIVGPGGITRNEHGYQLDPTVSTDEDAFLDLVDQARNLLTAGDPVTAGEAFRAALAIWRGERAFDDVRDELVEPDRARLDEVRTAVVEELTTAILDHPAAGTPAEAYALAARLIEQHPLRERAHQLAMLACYRDHHQVRALEIYRDLVRRLRTELGIEPGPATARLHAQILRQDVALEPPGPTGPPRRRRTTRTGPPAPVTPIIGREESTGTIRSALAAGRRLVTLTGPPGVGKSRLLQEIGADDRPDRIVYVRLDGADVPDRVGRTGLAAALAVALGAAEPRRSPVDALVASLSGGACLLLVDEAERVAAPLSELLMALLGSCPWLRAVVASRTPLAVPGEVLVPVPPLGVPPGGAEPAMIRATPAVRLLTLRLTDLGIPVGSDPTTAARLGSIARSTGGLPLALELLAGQSPTRTLSEIAAMAEAPLDVAAATPVGNPRHRTLRDAIRSSTGRLSPTGSQTLRRLSVFEGDFDRVAAYAVVGTPPGNPPPIGGSAADDLLREPARAALVQVHRPDGDRLTWRLLPAVRALVGEELVGAERDRTRARHRRWFAERWREADGPRDVSPVGSDDLVRDVHDHLDDYLAALRSALDDRDGTSLPGLTSTLARYWQSTGASGVGLRWTTEVLRSGLLDPASSARIQVQRAAMALHHHPDITLSAVDVALPTLLANGLTGPALLGHLVRAVELCSSGRGADAMVDAEAALTLTDGRGPGDRARAFSVLAIACALAGEPERAAAAAAAARAVGPALDVATRSTVATNLAWALLHLDEPGTAQDVLDELSTAQPPGSVQLLVRGWVLIDCWRPAAALAAFTSALAPGPPVADRQSAETFLGAACAMAALGLADADADADAVLRDAEALARRVGLVLLPVVQRAVDAAHAAGDPERAAPASGAGAATDLAGRLRDRITAAAAVVRGTPVAAAVDPGGTVSVEGG